MAPPIYSVTFSAAGQSLLLPSHLGLGKVYVQVVGSGTMTLQYQDSYDGGVTFQPVRVRNMNAGTDSTDMTAAGLYTMLNDVLPVVPRITVSAFTSGTFTVYVKSVPQQIRQQFPLKSQVFSAGGQIMTLPSVEASDIINIQLVGSGTLTVQLQDSLDDGTTYVPIRLLPAGGGASLTDLIAAGLYITNGIAHLIKPRLFVSAFTSGTMAAFVIVTGRSPS